VTLSFPAFVWVGVYKYHSTVPVSPYCKKHQQ